MVIVPRDESGAVDLDRFTELFTESVHSALASD